MASETAIVDLVTKGASSAWSLGCDITIEEMDVVVEEIKLNDIAIAGVVKTDGITVDIDHDKNNVMDLDVNVVIDGLNSSIVESQVVPYERVVEINDLSPESSYEKGFAASAKSVKKVKDSVDSLGNTVKTNTSNISKVAFDVNSLTRRVDRLSEGAGGEDLGGIWYIDETTGNLVTDKQVEIKNSLIVGGDTASTGVGEDPGTTGIDEAQLKEYLDENKYITSEYAYSKQEVDNKIPSLDGYVTNEGLSKTLLALNLGQYLKSEDAENTYAKITELKKYLLLESANQTIKGNITIEGNLVVRGDTSSTAKGTDSGVAGTLLGIKVNGTTYDNPVNGILTIPDYPTSLEWSAINGKPTKLTEFTNDAGFITSAALNGYAKKTDIPTSLPASDVYEWAKAATKPSYTKSEVGLGNVENKSSATIRGEITATNVTNALGYTPANNASLADYLPKSGGTISGTTTDPIIVNTSAASVGARLQINKANKAYVGYGSSVGAYLYNYDTGAYIGIDTSGSPFYHNGTIKNTLIHSGNIGSQKVERARYIETQAYDGSKWYADEYRLYAKWSASNILSLEVEGGYPIQVNQATKLGTARTIWGQSFDGTGNVSGALYLGNESPVYFKDTAGNNVAGLYVSSGNNMWMGYHNGTSIKSCIVGSEVRLYYGGNSNIGLILNSSGNVTIGASDLASTTSKLYVNGAVTMSSTLSIADAINSTNTSGLDITACNGVAAARVFLTNGALRPWLSDNGLVDLGTSGARWKGIYCKTGNFSDAVKMSSRVSIGKEVAQQTTGRAQLSIVSTTDVPTDLILGPNALRWSITSRNSTDQYPYSLGIYDYGAAAYRMRITSAGDVYIYKNLVVSGDTSSGSDIRFKDKLSDHRIALSDIAEAPLFTFKWNDREDDSVHLGSSAQYWEKVAPWLVKGEDFKTLDYSTLGVAIGISLANKAVNHEERIKILEDKVKALEAENRRLRYGS